MAENEKEIKEAIETLEEISSDEAKERMAEPRQKYIIDRAEKFPKMLHKCNKKYIDKTLDIKYNYLTETDRENCNLCEIYLNFERRETNEKIKQNKNYKEMLKSNL